VWTEKTAFEGRERQLKDMQISISKFFRSTFIEKAHRKWQTISKQQRKRKYTGG